MRWMIPFLLPTLAWLAACSPAWNWREVRLEDAPLTAVLPCKADQASQTVTLAGATAELQMTGCESGGATLAVSRVRLPSGASAAEALSQWRAVTLAGMRAQNVQEQPFQPVGSLALPQSTRVVASGRYRDGRAVNAQAVWFAQASPQGVWLYHAVIYADAIGAEVADTFFSGLKLRAPT
jgi:hypothetical protein